MKSSASEPGQRSPLLVIRDLTKLRRRRQREQKKRQLCTPFCTFLCRPCNNYDVKWQILSWLEKGNGKAIHFALWTRTRSPLFSSHLTSLLSSNWVTCFKGEKVSKFHRRFHRRCRCRIVRSYVFIEGGKGNASKAIGVCTQPTRQTPEMRMSFLHSSEFDTSFNSQLFSDLFFAPS